MADDDDVGVAGDVDSEVGDFGVKIRLRMEEGLQALDDYRTTDAFEALSARRGCAKAAVGGS